MKTFSILLLIQAFYCQGLLSANTSEFSVPHQKATSDTIQYSETWGPGIVDVANNVVVNDGAKLTIVPGTQLNFLGSYSIWVHGCLSAIGTPDSLILFLPQDTLIGWKGLCFDHMSVSNDTSRLDFCMIKHAKSGDAVFSNSSLLTISNSTIARTGNAHAIRLFDCSPIFYNVLVSDNSYDNLYGSALYMYQSDASFTECSFLRNSSIRGAGAFIHYYSNPVFNNCTFAKNKSQNDGGALYIWDESTVSISNSLIRNNNANVGGGIWINSSCFLDITNCTLFQNYATQLSGCWAVDGTNKIDVKNSIIWGNIDDISIAPRSIVYSDVQRAEWTGWGNIFTDPLFVNESTYNLQLKSDSPCIDAGDPDPQFNDPDGTRNDMGAFYFDQGPLALKADFIASDFEVIVGNSIIFTDLSTGDPTSWQWDFEDDGTIDEITQNPNWTYTEPGIYTVSLTIGDGINIDTEVKTDYIIVNDYIAWQCGDLLVDARDGQTYTTVQIGSQCWMSEHLNIGDRLDANVNQTNNNTIEKYCYDNNETNCDVRGGLYQWNEMMQYSTSEGIRGICPIGWHLPTDSEWTTLTTYVSSQPEYLCNNNPLLIAKALASATLWTTYSGACAIGDNLPTNNSTGFTAVPGGYRENDGQLFNLNTYCILWSSTQNDLSNSWNRFLDYNQPTVIKGSVIKDRGFSVRCLKDEITLGADFESDKTQGIAPLQVHFTDLSLGNPTIWQWDFQNDGEIDSFDQNPIWIYNEPGVYAVSLTIGDGINVDTELKENFILVLDTVLILSDPISQAVCMGSEVIFSISALGYGRTYQWQKENENLSGANDSILIFESVNQIDAGNYRCIVSNLISADTSAIAQLTVYPSPEISLGNDTAICSDNSITFDAGAGYSSYSWNDGSSFQTLTTDTAGIYWVEVENSYGCKSTDSIILSISSTPTAYFSFSQMCNGNLVNFTDQSTIAKNSITSWDWDFGDPLSNQDTSSAQNPSYSYFSSGLYDVYLRVTTSDGCIADTIQTIQIYEPLKVDLGADIKSCLGNTIEIIPAISGGKAPYDYFWSISNGINSTDSVLNLTINSNLNVMLQITDSNGCQASDEVNISINQVFQDEEICLVTVDNVTGKNMIIWEKTPDVGTAYFNVYRFVGSSFQKIASVPYNSLSAYIDPSANPRQRSFKYSLAAVDSCGNVSALSESHKTIHLSANMGVGGNVNLAWTPYQGFTFDYYHIYRGSSPANLVKINSVENDLVSYTDLNPPPSEIFYEVGVEKLVPCYPDGSKAGPFKQSLSNIADNLGGRTQQLNLEQGWNGLSLYITPYYPLVQTIFNPIVNNLIILKDLLYVYWPGQNINTIGVWDKNTGYAAKLSEQVLLAIEGPYVTPAQVTFSPGWHYLPVLRDCEINLLNMVISQLGNIIIVQELVGDEVFWPEMNIYTLQTLKPGKAYKIKVRNSVTLNFPSCNSKNYSVSSPTPNSITTNWGELKMNPFTHLLAFKDFFLSDFVVDGDQIGAFTQDNVLCGFLTVGERKSNRTITLFADDPTTPDCDGYKEGEALNFRLFRPGTEETFDLDVDYDPNYDNDGTFKTNGISVITKVKQSALAMNEVGTGTIRIYPNPTEGMVELTFNDLTEIATIRVSDLQNNDYIQVEMDGSNQEQKRKLDLTALAPGVYLISVTGETFRFVKKIIVM